MAEFIAYVHEAGGADGAGGGGPSPAVGTPGDAPPDRRIAVLVTARAAALPGLDARLGAALEAPAPAGGAGSGPGAAAVDGPGDGADGPAADLARLRGLGWLAGAGIRCHAVVVDWREASAAGPLRGGPAAQAVHAALYEAMAVVGRDTEVRTDAAGAAALAAGLERHAAGRHEADLFRPAPAVRAAPPGAAPMRLAGLLARCVAHGFRGGRADAEGAAPADPGLRELLRAGWLTLEEWPPARGSDPPARGAGDTASDTALGRAAVDAAWRFIADAAVPRDEDGRVQRIVLTHLLSTALHGDGGYVSSAELLQLLAARGYGNLQEHYLQSAIVAGLRDSGVPVTSSSRGYKIPQARQDLLDFVNLVDGQVIPLLERLARVRQALGAVGGGAAWGLDDPRHAKLRRVMEALEDGAASGDPPARR